LVSSLTPPQRFFPCLWGFFLANLTLTAIINHLVTLKALRVSVNIYCSKPVAAAWTVTALVLVVFYHLATPLAFS